MQTEAPNLYSVLSATLPALLWPLILLAIFFIFRDPVATLVNSLAIRVKGGAAVRLFQMEIGALPSIKIDSPDDSMSRPFADDDFPIAESRVTEYERTKCVEIVHKIAPTPEKGQLYDILIYAIPHRGGSLLGLTKVEYYLAKPWGDRVLFSDDRARGFAIRTAAYGPFLLLARLFFNDDSIVDTFRYVDFEMGSVGS